MKKGIYRGILVLAIILGVIALGLYLYTLHLKPKLSGTLEMPELREHTEVHFDGFGIPHIYAQNAHDAYMSLGYIHAQDRLFQMELMRRAGKGELSEVLGIDLVEADMLFRTLGTHRKAKLEAEKMRKEDAGKPHLEMIDAYLAGINRFIEEGPTPIEFTLASIPKEQYTLEDMHAIAGYMSFSFAYALRADPIMEYMHRNLTREHMNDLSFGRILGTEFMPPCDSLASDTANSGAMGYFDTSVLDELPVPVLQGSNSWAIAPQKSKSGKVLLANDTHIKFQQPSVWYEAHLEYPGTSFYGNFLGGIPFALIGHSKHHAWGLTMFENDDMDLFEERYTEDREGFVYDDSLTFAVRKRAEVISIKDRKDTVLYLKEGPHGPIANHLLNESYDNPISLYWTYTDLESKLPEAFYRMNHADNLKEFEDAVSTIHAPGLNVIYGDDEGHIALWAAARLVKRPDHVNGKYFLEGWTGKDDHLGYHPFSSNPQYVDPPCGYLYSANNPHDSTAAGPYPGYYAPENRARRITDMLESKESWSLEELKKVSLDTKSPAERAVCQEIVSVLETRKTQLSKAAKLALPILENWDGSHELEDKAPAIYYPVLIRLMRNTMEDEMGEEQYRTWTSTHLFKQTYPILVSNKGSIWWDDVSTGDVREKRADIIQRSFESAVEDLRREFGPDMQQYRWGDLHSVTFDHALGKVDALAPLFNVGPLEAPGGNETVNNAGFNLGQNEPFSARYGPQMRILLDFADVEHSISVLPTGQSGNVFSPHYQDQVEMFLGGKFRKQLMDENEIRSTTEAKLMLEPAE